MLVSAKLEENKICNYKKEYVKLYSFCGEISVEKVELDVTTKTIDTGSTFKLNATITPNDATNTKLLWSSSNRSVASVDNEGKVTQV